MCGLIVALEAGDSVESFRPQLDVLKHRGPDDQQVVNHHGHLFIFQRLAIMDLSAKGSQPFYSAKESILVCNGEIYNYLPLKSECKNHQFKSDSDCEVLLPLYETWGIEKLLQNLDGEFAFVLWDKEKNKCIAARDPMGIRPLFYGVQANGQIAFASEVKALSGICHEITPVKPGHYFDGQEFKCYLDLSQSPKKYVTDINEVLIGIRTKLTSAVEKRLHSDAEVGFLLSGGLDSSLVCALSQKMLKKPIQTFSIGMEHDAIDSKYAEEVARHIGAHHTSVVMKPEDVLGALKKVIYHLETWDITTVRASIGMYLVCKYIREKTKIKVLLTGEVSDELFGYKYTDFAPSPEAFQNEASKRIRELYLYDVLRADRCISAHALEARVPFSDKDFVSFAMSIDPALKMNTKNMGKFLLREAFNEKEKVEKDRLLPDHILWRDKAAFSDAVGHSMVDILKDQAEKKYSEQDLLDAKKKYPYRTPYTKESLMYREIFETFYPNRAELIADFWLPNQEWQNCKVSDPSARVLPNYGASGV